MNLHFNKHKLGRKDKHDESIEGKVIMTAHFFTSGTSQREAFDKSQVFPEKNMGERYLRRHHLLVSKVNRRWRVVSYFCILMNG